MTDTHGSQPQHAQPQHRDDPHHRPPGHEREIDRNINLRGVGLTVLGLLLGTILAMAAMWWMYESMLADSQAEQPQPPPLAAARQPTLPPGPRLQSSPTRDMAQFLARENALLSSYGWRDEAAGTVRIPISRAMEVVAEEGLESSRAALSTAPDPQAGDDLQTKPEAGDAGGGTATTAAGGGAGASDGSAASAGAATSPGGAAPGGQG